MRAKVFADDISLIVVSTVPTVGVSPDTLEFEISNGSKKFFAVSPESQESFPVVQSLIMSVPMKVGEAKMNEEREGDVLLLSKGDDTLYYDDGTRTQSWYGANYFGVKFNPSKEYVVKTALVNLYMTSSNNCNVSICPDVGGSPGTAQETISFTASDNWNSINFTSNPTFSGPFWITCFVPTANPSGPYFGGDASGGQYSYYSLDGSTWANMSNSDLMIRAVVGPSGPIEDTVRTMVIKNIGGGTLNVTGISVNQSWVTSLSPTTFSLTSGQSKNVAVTASSIGLSNGTHYATITIQSNDSMGAYSQPVKFVVDWVGIEETEISSAALTFTVKNFPNPFGEKVIIQFDVPTSEIGKDTQLEIFDISGRTIRVFPIHSTQSVITWDGRDNTSNRVAHGIYFYKLKLKTCVKTGKLVLMK